MGIVSTAPYLRRVVDEELDELFAAIQAIAIEGPKAVGKTATASQRATTIFELDDPSQREIALADLDRLIQADPPVLIDEWQYVPASWDRVRRAVDRDLTPGRYLLAGSASPDGTGTHSGGGRIVSLRMRPLALSERLTDPPTVSLAALLRGGAPEIGGQSSMRVEDYTDEILRSGFPGLRHLRGAPLRAQLDGYLQRVIDRDFPELGHPVRNPSALRDWMAAYAAATSQTTSFEKIRQAASAGRGTTTTRKTALPYREVLERLYLIDELPGWVPQRNHLARLSSEPKHHLADPALAARLLGVSRATLLHGGSAGPDIIRDGTLLGALFESLITLSVRVYAQADHARVYHFRTHAGEREADLIVVPEGGGVVAFEIKLAASPDDRAVRHLTWLKDRIGDELLDAVIITTGTEAYRRQDGIAVVPAALLGP